MPRDLLGFVAVDLPDKQLVVLLGGNESIVRAQKDSVVAPLRRIDRHALDNLPIRQTTHQEAFGWVPTQITILGASKGVGEWFVRDRPTGARFGAADIHE